MTSSPFELNSLNGENGFIINGIDIDDNSGVSVSSAGDVNGDGFGDLIIGARYADPNGDDSGESYVVFGRSSGFSSTFDLSSLNGSNGFTINGIDDGDLSGISVSSAGDVNDDGFDDLIIGAEGASPNSNTGAGKSYVVFGWTGFPATFELSSLGGSARTGFFLNGIDVGDLSGRSVSSAGDVNGDGADDFIIGARLADPNGRDDAGQSYVVFGRRRISAFSGGFSSRLELSSLNGSNGFLLNGINAGDYSGRSVSSAGDVNGDGVDDLIIGADGADPRGNGSGESYVVYGTTRFSSTFELSSLDGGNGFTINGLGAGDRSGYSVSGAGDVNGDGVDDLIIGAYRADPNGDESGESYVVFGSSSGLSTTFELSSLNGSNGFILRGIDESDQSGRSISGAGDINGDGVDDLIIGARAADPN
ncbi:MAG: integrin alpha, partial [Cyanobacteria bacterium P01_G01_bin.4]